MNAKLRNTLLFILLNICVANGQKRNKTRIYGPGEFKLDSVERLKLCAPTYIFQYYELNHYNETPKYADFKNAKSSAQILNEWNAVFKKPENFTQSGFLTVRFVVNCTLETCCYHVYEMDENYQPTTFDDGVKKQLIGFIKNLNGWKSAEYKGTPTNYFYYLNFVIKNGAFKNVSP